MIKIAIVGLGHWGPNYLRIFSQLDETKVLACVDQDPSRLKNFSQSYPEVHFYQSLPELYQKETVDAVVIATPTSTHYPIALETLKRGHHVLIKKPLALKESECVELTELAKKQERILMVGHTFLYNHAVVWLKNFLNKGDAGKTYYLYATRTNLGPIRQDVNAMIDLAPHDISIFLYLLGKMPTAVSAHGAAFLNPQREDVNFLTLYFDDRVLGHIHVSWLDPRKVRQITVIGDKKMAVFDDINTQEPVRIYDKSVISSKEYSDFGEFKTIVYEGDVTIPRIQLTEPLKNQCKQFAEAIRTRTAPLSDGVFGTNVARVLVGAAESLKQSGKIVPL